MNNSQAATLTGRWKRQNNCIMVHCNANGWLPAPMTENAPVSQVQMYLKWNGFHGEAKEEQ